MDRMTLNVKAQQIKTKQNMLIFQWFNNEVMSDGVLEQTKYH